MVVVDGVTQDFGLATAASEESPTKVLSRLNSVKTVDEVANCNPVLHTS